jgi:hypothetical protein
MYHKITLFVLGGLALLTQFAFSEENRAQIGPPSSVAPVLITYKSAKCGCCNQWLDHVEESSFSLSSYDVIDLPLIKKQHAIEPRFQSCHTSKSTEGYVFEGHIPAKLIHHFLQNPPIGARGLAVPAMPLGIPGMEYGSDFTPYKVWQLNSDGSQQIYATINTARQQF